MAGSGDTARPLEKNKTVTLPPRLQTYANQSLTELTEKLVKWSKEEKGRHLSSRTRDIVYVLKVDKLRHPTNAHVFLSGRGVDSLLSLLSLCAEQEGRDRGLLMATLANLCALHSDCRSKVMSHGLPHVASVLTHSETPATLCTVARLVANLALDPSHIPRLQGVGVVRELSHALFFQAASDPGSKLSVLRALRVLSSNGGCREELKSSEGLPGLVECLKSTDEKVAASALHTLHVLLVDSDPDVVQALVTHKGLSPVVRLCNHGEQEVGDWAVEVLVMCARVSEGRVGLHSTGGVECLLGRLQELEADQRLFPSLVGALCASCKDVGGRQRMRDCGGLETLIHLLGSPDHPSLHPDILSALVCYYFDEQSLKFMVKRLGLLRVLTFHLQRMSSSRTIVNQDLVKSSPPDEEEGKKEEEESKAKEGEGKTEEETEGNLTGSVDNGSEVTSASSCSRSPTHSGFESTTSQATSSPFPASLPSPSPTDHSTPSLPPPTPSPHSSHSPSSPSSPSTVSLSSSSPADSQPPVKRPRLSADLDFAHPTPVNFLDSLLSSPSPYQTPPRRPELISTPETSTSLESHVVQLLSRISHMRDCLPLLASHDLLLATLNCLLSSPSFLSSHIFKTLSRVFANPNCFQEAISCLVPSRLYYQFSISQNFSPPTASIEEILDLSSPVPSLPSPSHTSPSSAGSGLAHMCRELLTQLSRVGQSPYGQGVLAHFLLAGEGKDQTASALATPLLIRTRRSLKKLMVDFRGQEVLVQLITSSSDLRDSAADSFLKLAFSADMMRPQELLNLIFPFSPPKAPTEPNLSCPYSGVGCKPRCCYRDYDHCPFDYSVKLDRHGTQTQQNGMETEQCETRTQHIYFLAHRAVLAGASEVFNVMLGGGFMESCESEVHLKDVHPWAFLSLLHHVYGCGWDCQEASEAWDQEDHSHNDLSDISSSLIAAVISKDTCVFSHPYILRTLRCLETASRFLLDSMRQRCERRAATLITMPTLVPLFLFSQLHGSVVLAEKCLQRLLFSRPSSESRSVLLQLASCPEATAALALAQKLISSKLHTTT